jgi:hypothetical protein
MDALKSILKMATEISSNLKRVNEVNVKKSTGEMLELNKGQMDQGLLNTSAPIKPIYTVDYAKKKGFWTPNLKLKGHFRRGMYIDVMDDSLKWWSTDHKTEKLTDWYTVDIFGLTKNNAVKWANNFVYKPTNKWLNGIISKTL